MILILIKGANLLPYKNPSILFLRPENVYATLGNPENRYITVDEKLYCEELSDNEHKSTILSYHVQSFKRT